MKKNELTSNVVLLFRFGKINSKNVIDFYSYLSNGFSKKILIYLLLIVSGNIKVRFFLISMKDKTSFFGFSFFDLHCVAFIRFKIAF